MDNTEFVVLQSKRSAYDDEDNPPTPSDDSDFDDDEDPDNLEVPGKISHFMCLVLRSTSYS